MVLSFRSSRRPPLCLGVVLGLAMSAPTSAGQPPPQLFVSSVAPDADGILAISGGNFGARPFVTLELIPLDIISATNASILAAAPVASIPSGEYLLTVSRGPTPAENASYQVTFGAVEPARPEAPAPDGSGAPATAGAAALPPIPAGNAPAAQVGDRSISIEEVDREWRRTDPGSYLQLVRQLDELRRRVVNAMVADELLAREAAARGVSVEALVAEEIPKRVIPISDSAVTSLYLSIGAGARGASLDQMKPALRAWLERHSELELAKMSYVEELKQVSYEAEILLKSPRVQIERASQDVALGPAEAPVEIVAFGDFQSVEYVRFARAFSTIRDTFGDRVRFLFKNLPTLGPQSVAAAEAALCANAQGAFWPYHDALAALGVINSASLAESARALGLDQDAFSECVAERYFRVAIQGALKEAARYGIQSSPGFLVNGRLAPPAPAFLTPYDYFKLLIEEELSAISRASRIETPAR